MKNKNLIILSLVFIFLVGFLLLRIFSPQIFSQKLSLYQEKINPLKNAPISTLKIAKEDKIILLNRENDVWKLNGKLVDKEKINQLVDKLINKNQAQLIAETPLKHEDFEVTDNLATEVEIDKMLTLLIGKSSIDGQYVRFKDSDLVFLLKNITSSDFSLEPNNWYDKTIISIEEQDIKNLVIQKGTEKITVVQKEGEWFWHEKDQEINTDKLNPIILTLASFKARSIAETNTIVSFPPIPYLRLQIEYTEGEERLSFFKGENDYLIKRESDGENFIVGKFQAEDFDISSEDLYKTDF